MPLPQAFCGWRFARELRLVPSGRDVAAISGAGTRSRKHHFHARRKPSPHSGIGLLVAPPHSEWTSLAGSSSEDAWKPSRSSWIWTRSAQSFGGPRAGETAGGSNG